MFSCQRVPLTEPMDIDDEVSMADYQKPTPLVDAMDIVNNEEMILEQCIEALKILKMCFHKDALEHLRQFTQTSFDYWSDKLYLEKISSGQRVPLPEPMDIDDEVLIFGYHRNDIRSAVVNQDGGDRNNMK